MRLALAIAAGLLCALAGMRQSSALLGEEKRLRRWHALLTQLSFILSERSASLPEAMRITADRPLPPDMLLHTVAAQMLLHPMLPLQDLFEAHCPSWPEKATLLRMCTHLGHGSLESRQSAVQTAAAEVAALADAASAKAQKDAKLWRTLGFLGGACLTLLLI